MKFIAAAAMALTAFVQGAAQSPPQAPAAPPPETSAISGVVIDAISGEPVENASVQIEGTGAKGLAQTRQMTDAKGRFVFANLPPAQDYTLSAALPGYFSSNFTRSAAIGASRQQIPVKPGEWIRDLPIKMWRPGAITGRVVDERGEPMVGIFVRALKRAAIAGREQLVNASITTTDDRGVYRIPDLDPGRYLVEVPSVQGATPPSPGAALPAEFIGTPGSYPTVASRNADGRARAYPITFYPSARTIHEAGSIDLQVSEQRAIADVVLTPVPVFTVAGRIIGQTDGLTLRLMPAGLEALGNGSEASQSIIGADGAYTFESVPAGSYVLAVGRKVSEVMTTFSQNLSLPSPKGTLGSSSSVLGMTAAPPGMLLRQSQYGSNPRVNGRPLVSPTTRVPVAVGGDISDFNVTLKAGAVVEAVVVFDPSSTTAAKPTIGQLGLSLESATGDSDLGIVNPTTGPAPPAGSAPDYRVRFDDVGAGEFWLRSRSSKWVVQSIEAGAQDLTIRPFDTASTSAFSGVTITMTDRVAAVSGAVKEPGAMVIVFPADQSLWTNFGFNPSRIATAMMDDKGQFLISSLAAGDYFVLAVPREEQYAWLEPGYFARASTFATRTTLGWGDRRTFSLSIARVPR